MRAGGRQVVLEAVSPETRRLRTDLEWRAGDPMRGPGVLSGIIMRYGDTAEMPWGRERFEPGALRGEDVVLNFQHDRGRPLARYPGGGMEIEYGAAAVTMRAVLPDTTDARDLAALVRAGVMRGLSVEFVPGDERLEAGVRVIGSAVLQAVGVVDDPAYAAATVEAMRARQRAGGAPRKRRTAWRSWR